MFLSGVRVPDNEVLQLATRLRDAGRDETAERLELAYDLQTQLVPLTASDREAILETLDDCDTEAMARLRSTLRVEFRARFNLDLKAQPSDLAP